MRLTPRPLCVNTLEQSRCEHACGSLYPSFLSPSCEAPRSRGAAFCGCLRRGAPSSGSCRFRSRSVSSVLIMNVQNLFVATATDGSDQPAAPRLLVLPVHPGEDAAAKQEDDFWRAFNHVLSNVDAIHLSRATYRPVSLRLSKRILRKWSGFNSLPHPKRMLPQYQQHRNTINSSRLRTRKTRASAYSSLTTDSDLRKRFTQRLMRLYVPKRVLCSHVS
jgi:hypothetical protein